MSEASKMPARIWAEDTRDYGAWFERKRDEYPVEYIRADIAEQMAEALRESSLQITYLHQKFQRTGSGEAVLSRNTAALSAWEASNPAILKARKAITEEAK
jgi:hypothetical protein